MSSRPSSTGMSKTLVSGTLKSNAGHLNSTVKSNVHTDPMDRSFTSFLATREMLILKPNWTNGSASTIPTDPNGAHARKTPYEALREKL